MIPLLGVVLGTAFLRALGAAGGRWTSWRAALVPPLAMMYVLTGLASFTAIGEDLARFIPRGVPHPLLLVRLSGAIQIGAGPMLLSRRWRPLGEACLIALLVAKLPLNWLGASQRLMVRGPLPTPPALRVPFALLWVAVLLWVGRDRQRPAGSTADSTPSSR